jgi:integrase
MGQIEKFEILQKEFLRNSKSDNTKRAYRSDWNKFCSWCSEVDKKNLPADPKTVAMYISYLAHDKSISTISRSLTSISQAHKILSIQSPTIHPEVIETFKGIKRKLGSNQKHSKPLVLKELEKVIKSITPTFIGHRDKAMILLGWAAALRRSELVSIEFDDIECVEEGIILTIRKSKTDQEGEGYRIGIPHAMKKDLCPVKALKNWISLSKINYGPIFFRIGPKTTYSIDISERKRLSERSVNKMVKRRIKKAGYVNKNYSSHSLRAGFITSAAAAKIPEYQIQIHTRHRSTKSLRGYIRDGSLFNSNSLSILL